MIRMFYQSDLPGNLLFEAIFNPGDFQNFDAPYEGTAMGVPAWASRFSLDGEEPSMGMYSWLREKWTRDAPGWNTSNWEGGFRIRGNTFDIDWTLLYWNARDDGPVANPYKVGRLCKLYVIPGVDESDWDDYPDKSSIIKDIRLSAEQHSTIHTKFGTLSGDSNGFMKSDARLIKRVETEWEGWSS